MLDEAAIRKTMIEINGELETVERRREALLTARSGLEALLTLRSAGTAMPLFTVPSNGSQNQPRGSMSLRSAVLKVVKDARGHPLHVKEILKRAKDMGASTQSKEPLAIVDLTFYSLKKAGEPVMKTAGRTWRWVEP